MQFIDFRDNCIIRRVTDKDEWDNSIRETVYEGKCLYQEGGSNFSGYGSIFSRTPTLFLPDNYEGLIEINDAVTVTTERGRTIQSVVEVARDINLDRFAVSTKVTRLSLKQAQGD